MVIDEVYKLVQTFANKEQRGYITPSEFNLLAQQAELELYNKRLKIIIEKSQPKKAAGFYNETLSYDVARQDLSAFLNTSSINVSQSASAGSPHLGAIGGLKTDYIEAIYTAVDEEHSIHTNIPVDIVEPKDVAHVLRSNLVKPSFEYPIALIGKSGENEVKKISVFPEEISSILVYHYSYDNKPTYGYVTIAGKPVFNFSTSIQLKISSRCHGEVVVKILEYLGVTIREAEVVQYAQANELKKDS
jgi:hypothetical protein